MTSHEDQINELKKEIDETAYAISHDFSAPMRHVEEFSKILIGNLGDRVTENDKKYIAIIEKSNDKLKSMLNAITQLSRISEDKEETSLVDCNDVVKNTLERFSKAIDDNNIDVKTSNLPCLEVREKQFYILFFNLIENAIKFRNKDGDSQIKISCSESKDFWEIEVKDNGIGIEAAHSERIFQLFRKLHTDQVYEGTGAGLTVCKKIARVHGGDIKHSTDGDYSAFLIRIPK